MKKKHKNLDAHGNKIETEEQSKGTTGSSTLSKVKQVTANRSHNELKDLLDRGMNERENFGSNLEIEEMTFGLFIVSSLSIYWGHGENTPENNKIVRAKIEHAIGNLSRSELRKMIETGIYEQIDREELANNYVGYLAASNGVISEANLYVSKTNSNGYSQAYRSLKLLENESKKTLIQISKIFGSEWKFDIELSIERTDPDDIFNDSLSQEYTLHPYRRVRDFWAPRTYSINSSLPFTIKSLKEVYDSAINHEDFEKEDLSEFSEIMNTIEKNLLKDKLEVELNSTKPATKRMKL